MKIYILNTTVAPCAGLWDVQNLDVEHARRLAALKPFVVSAVGHESTANIISAILRVNVPVNRISVTPVKGDQMVCFKLKQRAPEGKILSETEIEYLGYEFFLMELIAPSKESFTREIRDQVKTEDLWKLRCPPKTETREFLGGHRD
jgi:hypothetical protein